jgi:hypothetical protein
MHKKAGRILKVSLLSIFILFVITHSTFHALFFKTSVSIINLTGLSGKVIGEIQITNELENNIKTEKIYSTTSAILILMEWTFLFIIMLLIFFKRKSTSKEAEIGFYKIKKKKSQTEIDLFYDLLKEKKKIKFTTASKLFKVNSEIIGEWADALENNNLAIVDYPRFGSPAVSIKEQNEK